MTERPGLLGRAKVIERLRLARQAKDITQTELADSAGLTPQQVSLVELDKRGLSLDEFRALCRAMDLDPRDVLSDVPLPVEWV